MRLKQNLSQEKLFMHLGSLLEKIFEIKNFKSNLFEMEWPRKSGKKKWNFQKVDKVDFFSKILL